MAQARGREEEGGRKRKRERKETNERRQCSESGGTKEIRNERSPTERPPPPCPLALSFHLSSGKSLRDVRGQHLVDTRGGASRIIDKGTRWLESGRWGRKGKETAETIPTQSDIFESIENGDGYSHRSHVTCHSDSIRHRIES